MQQWIVERIFPLALAVFALILAVVIGGQAIISNAVCRERGGFLAVGIAGWACVERLR